MGKHRRYMRENEVKVKVCDGLMSCVRVSVCRRTNHDERAFIFIFRSPKPNNQVPEMGIFQ